MEESLTIIPASSLLPDSGDRSHHRWIEVEQDAGGAQLSQPPLQPLFSGCLSFLLGVIAIALQLCLSVSTSAPYHTSKSAAIGIL